MTIATNIANESSNWSSAVVGTGELNRGQRVGINTSN